MPYLEESLEALNDNEQAIFAVCRRLKKVSDEAFAAWYPTPYGTQVSFEKGCLRLVSYPTLPRINNNSWSVIEQMELWDRWFRLKGNEKIRDFPVNQRFLIEILHHSNTELPFIPNTIEAHSFVNGLTTILGVDDNLSVCDYSVDVIVQESEPEYCEIRIMRHPFEGGSKPQFSVQKPLVVRDNAAFDNAILNLLPCLDELSDEQVLALFHVLIAKDSVIRAGIPYASLCNHYPMRRARNANKKAYKKKLEEKGFRLSENSETGMVSLEIDAPFRSREQYASDAFLEVLYRFLYEDTASVSRLRERKWRLTVLQKGSMPDGDNIPFDDLFKLFRQACGIPLTGPLEVRFSPDAKNKTSMVFSPVV